MPAMKDRTLSLTRHFSSFVSDVMLRLRANIRAAIAGRATQ